MEGFGAALGGASGGGAMEGFGASLGGASEGCGASMGGALEGAFRCGQAAEPAAGAVEADLGDLAEKDFGGEAEGEGVDAEGVAVADAADLEEGEVEPAGGGEGGGAAG